MGLFSSKSKTYVSTVTYPMGNDDPADYVPFHKYVVLNAVLQNKGISESITKSFLNSNGMKLRRAYAYARDHYFYGLPFSGMRFINSPDKDYIRDTLEALYSPKEVYLITAAVTLTDFTYWGERYLAETYGYNRILGLFIAPPKGVAQDATVSYDISYNGTIEIVLTNPGLDGLSTVLHYKPRDMSARQVYLHAAYQLIQAFPAKITKTTRPEEVGDFEHTSTTLVVVDRLGQSQETKTITHWTIDAGITTTTVRVEVRTISRPKYFFYQLGLGTYPTMDAWMSSGTASSPYFPSIPLRVDNVDVTKEGTRDARLYDTSKKLIQKVGGDFDDIAGKINTNESIKDIDFAFIQFGVALNSKTPECKKYLFNWLDSLLALTFYSQAETSSWIDGRMVTMAKMMADGTTNSTGDGGGGGGVPTTGTGVGFQSPPVNKLLIYDPEVRAKHAALDIEIQWQYLKKSVKTGIIGAHINDCTIGTTGSITQYPIMNDWVVDNSVLYARRQITADTFEEIEVGGLTYNNHIYQDKSVVITAWDAMNTPDEEGFIIPLSQEILREMSIKDITMIAGDSNHIVFNCYQIVKTKWYQSGFFAILMIVVAIVLLVVSWGASAPASSTMIGMAIGALTAAGVAATIAFIIVATMTVLVGMLISKLLTPVFTDIFGETWGPIIASVVSMLAMNWAATGSIMGGASIQMSQITSVDLIRGSIAAVSTYGKYLQGQVAAMDVPGQIEALKTEQAARLEEIEKLTKETLGNDLDMIDIQGFIDATAISVESAGTFLNRTLMTGSDIVSMTQGMITDFAEVGLYLPVTP